MFKTSVNLMAEERKRLVITDVSGLRPLGITNVWTTFSCQHIQKLLGCLNQDQSGGTHKQSTLPLLKRGGWHFLKTKYIWIKGKELSTLWFGRMFWKVYRVSETLCRSDLCIDKIQAAAVLQKRFRLHRTILLVQAATSHWQNFTL